MYELRDLICDQADPDAYLKDFDNSLRKESSKKQIWLAREREFQQLPAEAWQTLKDEARPYLTARARNGRGWAQLIAILNQARAYNYLVDQGYSAARFVPRKKGQRTPDLEAAFNGRKVLCEVKTIDISDEEAKQRQQWMEGGVGSGSTTNVLGAGFFRKLDSDIRDAKTQMDSYDRSIGVKRIVFVIVNFDDFLGEYKVDYFAQIDRHLAKAHLPGVDTVFYNERTAFYSPLTMNSAIVVNEAC